MGHGKEAVYRVPPASEFSSIKGIPQLEDLECALNKKGLKDPWIRYVHIKKNIVNLLAKHQSVKLS